MDYLKQPIIDYIKNNSDRHLDSVDICSHFQLRVDITMSAIYDLVQDGYITRHTSGLSAWYTVNKDYE